MSTTDLIKERIAGIHGLRLFYLPTLVAGEPIVREVFASPEVMHAVNEPWPENWMGQRHSEFRAVLDSFTRGDWLTASEDPDQKSPETIVARVKPVGDEIWDIRCIVPNARIRCFGAFGGKNMFIALVWHYREDLDSPSEWKAAIDECKKEWHRLFHPIERYRGASLDDYLSNYFVG